MLQTNTIDRIKTILLSVCILLSTGLFAQSENTSTKSTIVMTKSELNSFLSTVADARRSQLKERENKKNKSDLSELRSNYQQRSNVESYRQTAVSNEDLLREIRYLNQRIDNLAPNSVNSRFPSMSRDNSTIIMPSTAAPNPIYNQKENVAKAVTPSNNKQIQDLQKKIDSLKNVRVPVIKLTDNTAFSDSLTIMKSRITDVRRQMDSLESKMKVSKKAPKVDVNKSYFRQQVYFANNSETLEAQYFSNVQDLTQILIKYPEAKILLEGWASPLGSVTYNKQISMRRAEAVEKAFINNKIQANRILTSFKGEDHKSSAENARRVEMSIIVK